MEIYCTSSTQQSVDIYISSYQGWGSLYPACFLESSSREALLVRPKSELVVVFKAWVSCSVALIALLSPLGWKYTYIYNIAQLHLLRIQLTRSENPLAFKGFLFLFCCPYHCPRYSALSSALHTDSENLLVSFTRVLSVLAVNRSTWPTWGQILSHFRRHHKLCNVVGNEANHRRRTAYPGAPLVVFCSDVTKALGMALRHTEKSLTWSWLIEPLFP